MKVFKFGGASVNSVERIKNAAAILGHYPGEELVIIISAMGKTTNALEKVVEAFYAGKKEDAIRLFEQVKEQHVTTAKYLLVTRWQQCELQLKDFFTEVEWLLHDKPAREYDYYYDQVVCVGELLSTAIISHYLNETGISNKWVKNEIDQYIYQKLEKEKLKPSAEADKQTLLRRVSLDLIGLPAEENIAKK